MKTIFERIRDYVGNPQARPDGNRTPPADPPPEPSSDGRSSREDPYAEMRRVLAITMLLG